MKGYKLLVGAALLGSSLALATVPALAQEGILMKTEVLPGYCHMKFPAIQDSLNNGGGLLNPDLESANTTDVVDFYGPCDYDPTGKTEVQNQRIDNIITQDGTDSD